MALLNFSKQRGLAVDTWECGNELGIQPLLHHGAAVRAAVDALWPGAHPRRPRPGTIQTRTARLPSFFCNHALGTLRSRWLAQWKYGTVQTAHFTHEAQSKTLGHFVWLRDRTRCVS